MAVEETKTSDAESRNTGIYQRASKFVYIDHYCPNAKKYMLYNEKMTPDANRVPTDTNKFGTNMPVTRAEKYELYRKPKARVAKGSERLYHTDT